MCSAPLINTTLTLSIIVKCDTPHICFTRTDNKWDRKTHLATRDFYNFIISAFVSFCFISIMYCTCLLILNSTLIFLNNTWSEVNYWFIGCSKQSVDLGNNFVYQTPLCQVRCLSVEGGRVAPRGGHWSVMVSTH